MHMRKLPALMLALMLLFVCFGCSGPDEKAGAGKPEERPVAEKQETAQFPAAENPAADNPVEHTPEPEKHTSGDYEYIILENGTAEISKYVGEANELTIPEELDGIRVTGIGDEAFRYRISLDSVTIPDSVTGIGVNPFVGCSHLADIIVSIDHPYLATIDGVLFSKPDKRLVSYPCMFTAESYTIPNGIRIIGDSAFGNCNSLISVTIPDSVTSIGDDAFSWCSSLASIVIPDSVTSIGNEAFSICSFLASVTIPDSVTHIGDQAFYSCDSLTSVTIPESVTSIGENPFRNCQNLTDIIVSADHPYLAAINGVLFSKPDKRLVCYPRALTADSFAVPEGIRIIGGYAFSHNPSLTSVTIPDSVISIGKDAFSLCLSLTSVTIPDSVTAIGDGAFSVCSSLSSVTIPSSLASIGYMVFLGCNLTSVTIPESVTSIGDMAFYRCYSLTSVTIPDSVTSIGENAFTVHWEGKDIPIPDLTVTVLRDSYAAQYCKDNRIKYTYPDVNDWLNN